MLAFCVGLSGTLGWFSLLRHALHFFWMSPVLPWTFCAATVIVSLFSERLLQQAHVASGLAVPAHAPEFSPIY